MPIQNPSPSSGASVGYSRYSVLITQAGALDPTVVVLANELSGTPVWTRAAVGDYRCTLVGAFTADKTFFQICNNNPALLGQETYSFTAKRISADVIQVVSQQLDLSVPVQVDADGVLTGTPFEIRVYP